MSKPDDPSLTTSLTAYVVGGIFWVLIIALVTFLIGGSETVEEPAELKVTYSSYEENITSAKSILSGRKLVYKEREYVRDIANLDGTAKIFCTSGERKNARGVKSAYDNQAVNYVDSRDDSKGVYLPNRVQTRAYLPHCETIKSEDDFEKALVILKIMNTAFRVCGDIKNDTVEQLNGWNSCISNVLSENDFPM